jgi:hypothetical protein
MGGLTVVWSAEREGERARNSVRSRSLFASQTTYGWIMDDEEVQLLANLGLWLGDLLEFLYPSR